MFNIDHTHTLLHHFRDGHSYDRESITKWLKTSSKSPMTNKRLAHTKLVPNHNLRKAIADAIAERKKETDAQRSDKN